VQVQDTASIHEAMIALEKASISFQTMMQVRNKLLTPTGSHEDASVSRKSCFSHIKRLVAMNPFDQFFTKISQSFNELARPGRYQS
jgi:hypothetical protein